MKKISTFILLLLVGVGFNTAYSQDSTPLYAGHRDGGTGNVLTTIDTAGGTWTVTGTVTMTSDGGSVQGLNGISMHPITEEMYVLYESDGGAQSRRLGILDVETGAISDIGNADNMTDLVCDGAGNLYAVGGNWDSNYAIWEIDPLTAAQTMVFDPPGNSWGNTLAYDPFNDVIIRADRNDIAAITVGAWTEVPIGGNSGETQAMVVTDATTAYTVRYGSRYELNTTTGSLSFVENMGFNCHALGFGQVPCEPIDITATAEELCEGDEVTLTGVSETGGTITWSGGIDNGVPFAPGVPGVYTYTPSSDSDEDCPPASVVVEVIGLPTVLAGAGDLIFCEDESITLSASGDADLFIWNDGDPLDLMPGIGTYTFELVGFYTDGGCLGENDDEVTVEVVALPTITASASADPICINMEVFFTGTGGDMYMWDNSVVDGEPYIPGTLGTTTYTVIGTDENGCENTASVDVEVVDNIEITVAAIVLETVDDDGEIDIEITGGAPTYTYDWDNDETGDFDDTQDLTGLTTGVYTVVVIGAGGCEAEATVIVGRQVGLDDLNAANVAIYPNPTTEFINIDFPGTFQYELVTISGAILVAGTATDKELLNLNKFADGIYFVKVKNETTSGTIKVVKE